MTKAETTNSTSYTVCEDQPAMGRWDIEIRTFPTRDAAERWMRRQYTAAERNGDCDICKPLLRCDATGEYVA